MTILTMQEKVLDNAPQFKCQRCGACCKLVGLSVIPEVRELAKENTDACRYLTPDDLCSIYEERPIYCQVDGSYEQLIKQTGKTREEWYKENYKSCTYLRGLLGMAEPQGNAGVG